MANSSQPHTLPQLKPHHISFFLAESLILAILMATYHLCPECSKSQYPANQSAWASYWGVGVATPVHSGDDRQMLFFQSHSLPLARMLLLPSALMPCSIPRAALIPPHPKAQSSPQGLPYLSLDLSVWFCLTFAAPFLLPTPALQAKSPGELLGT